MSEDNDPVLKELKALRREVNILVVAYGAMILALTIVFVVLRLKP